MKTKEQEFTMAYETYADAIFRHCYYRIFDREAAKDIMQETFCRAWKYLAEGKEVENLRALLYRIATNIIIDESRKKKSASLNVMMEKGFAPKTDPREATQNHFVAQEVLAVMAQLDEKYRQVVIMKYIDGLSTKEIASIVGEKENNVYIRIHRGVKQVKGLLAKQENYGISQDTI